MNVAEKLLTPTPVKHVDHVAFLLDASGSMGRHWQAALRAMREQFSNVTSLDAPERAVYVTFSTFNTQVNQHVVSTRNPIFPSEGQTGFPDGGTAMLDAIGDAVKGLDRQPQNVRDTSYLIVVITDGEENQSQRETWHTIKSLIAQRQSRDNWSFVFLVPDVYIKSSIMAELDVPPGNVSTWDTTSERGYGRMSDTLRGSTVTYAAQRSTGARATRSFFEPDLGSIPKSTVNAVLDDVTGQYSRWSVPKECAIADFIGYQSGQPYVTGSTLYQLTKAEDVNADRELVLWDRKVKRLMGGNVRGLLGMSGSGVVRVRPGNHADYEIYVTSRSLNRKLVRGTSVLWRKS